MGTNLADGISQGVATGDEFRTAPLWGVGQRLFFLHDGRAADLLTAILAHSSAGQICASANTTSGGSSPSPTNCGGSEANQVIKAFSGLSSSQQQDLLNFLRSL